MKKFGKITNVVSKVVVKSLVKLLHSFRENFHFFEFLFALSSLCHLELARVTDQALDTDLASVVEGEEEME